MDTYASNRRIEILRSPKDSFRRTSCGGNKFEIQISNVLRRTPYGENIIRFVVRAEAQVAGDGSRFTRYESSSDYCKRWGGLRQLVLFWLVPSIKICRQGLALL